MKIMTSLSKTPVRFFLLAVSLLLYATPTAAFAQSPTQAYLDARDKAMHSYTEQAKKEAPKKSPRTIKEITDDEKAGWKIMDDKLAPLRAMMRDLIGPLDLAGFPTEGGEYTISSLDKRDPGSYELDGLLFTSLDGKTDVLVSTLPLLTAWLPAIHEFNKNDPGINVPTDIKAAFTSGAFYFNAFTNLFDTYVYKYAEIPVTSSSKDTIAGAILFFAAQDNVAPEPPTSIGVAVTHGNRVFVFTQDIKTPITTIALCKASYDKEEQAIKAAHDAADRIKDDRNKRSIALDKAYQMEDAANEHFLQCFAQHVSSQKYYPALIKQAQALVDKVQAATP